MPRAPKPRIFKNHYITDAGGRRTRLCLVSEGLDKAKRELIKHLSNLEQEKERNPNGVLIPYTVAECAAAFLRWKEGAKANRTFEDYHSRLRLLVSWYGDIQLGQITLVQGEEYFRRLQRRGIGNVTLNRYVQAAKAIFNYATRHGWLNDNPWRALEMQPEAKRQRVITDEEFEKLLATCEGYRQDGNLSAEENVLLMKEMLIVLRQTALRPGELRILRWDHLRPEARLIVIPPSEHKTGTTTKNPKPRIVPYLDDVAAIFERRRLIYDNDKWVFSNPDGKQWQDDALARRFSRLRNRAGLDAPDPATGEKICLYSLRHTRLTELGAKKMLESLSTRRVCGAFTGNE